MTCPKCNGDTRVLNRQTYPDYTWRRRECKECGYRFSTKERIAKLKGEK